MPGTLGYSFRDQDGEIQLFTFDAEGELTPIPWDKLIYERILDDDRNRPQTPKEG